MKTPFEEKGWTKNSLFRAVQGSLFNLGDMVWLSSDDGTETPYFTNGKDTYAQYFKRFEYLGEKDEMSRDKVIKKSPVSSGEAKHTAVVRFYESDGSLYYKDYHYKCDDSIRLKFEKEGPFTHKVDVTGTSKKIRVLNVVESYISSEATKTLPPLPEVVKVQLESSVKEVLIQGTIYRDLEIGDKVKIQKTSVFYRDDDKYNPKDIIGEVYKIAHKEKDIKVQWDNGTKNCYSRADLIYVGDASKVVLGIFRSGDKVKILKDTNGHEYSIGSIVTLETRRERTSDKGKFVWTTGRGENAGVVREEDIELVCNVEKYNPQSGLPEDYIWLKRTMGCCYSDYANAGYTIDALLSDGVIKKRESTVDNPLVIKDNKISKSDSLVMKTSEGISWTDLLEKSTTPWNIVSFEINKPTKEEINMSNQVQLVNIKLFDDDAGLKPTDRVVSFYANFATTSSSSERTLANALIKLDIVGDIAKHNEKRAATVDLTVLKNTGNKVFLQPIEFDDLRTEITKA